MTRTPSQRAREGAAEFVFSPDNFHPDPGMRRRWQELGDNSPIVQAFAQFEAETLERAWQDIATAPRDGSEIIAHDSKTHTSHVTMWTGYGWHDPDNHYYSEAPDFAPTLWMPLPPPPQGDQQ